MAAEALSFHVSEKHGTVSGLWLDPTGASRVLALAHGAGADMHHAFMQALSERLAARGVATLRYQFPYTEAGGRAPNRAPVLTATVRAAAAVAVERAGGRPVFAGGKSMGGRMTSLAASEAALPGVVGVVFVGFPLHAPGKPGDERATHLQDVALPLLFLQGTRDKLAELPLLTPVVEALSRATMHIVDGGDHSFHVLKRSGRTDDEVLDELAETIDTWTAKL
jgi:predicted alpha/beta-hydrolase family hydrolase